MLRRLAVGVILLGITPSTALAATSRRGGERGRNFGGGRRDCGGDSKDGEFLSARAYARCDLGRGRAVDGYPAGRTYLRELRAFLRRQGYAR